MHLTIMEPSVIHGTFVIERSLSAAPDRVFAALADPAKKRRWFAEEDEGQTVEAFEMDFRVGGSERARFRFKAGSPFPGTALASDSTYLDIVEGRRIVIASTMTLGEKRISASLLTFELLGSEKGTDLIFTHQGAFFEGSGGPKMREAGWQKLLGQLEGEVSR